MIYRDNEKEEEPARCYLVFYCTYKRFNMFRAALCPLSGAHDYISDYHMNRLILRLLVVGAELSPPDFDLFPKFKKPLRGKRFRSIKEVSNEMT
jgi:hypothetical protein